MTKLNFVISQEQSIRSALVKISDNQHGLIAIINRDQVVVAIATDGDIREYLIKGGNLDDPIMCCGNSNFIWANENTPRELILKQLDSAIEVIPLLDQNQHLIDFISRRGLPRQPEERTYARARSPVRMSFGGGGSDLTHFFNNESGAVINAAISLYSHATLRLREDGKVSVYSKDLGKFFSASSLEEFNNGPEEFRLIKSLFQSIQPKFGFDLNLHSDFPISSGLGGSAVISAAVLGCFNQFRTDKWGAHELAELAFQSERLYLGIKGGWQDQYATVFGGFNFMEFKMDQNIIHPLRIVQDVLFELEECLILCDTGIAHDSGEIHRDQRQTMGQESILSLVRESVALTYKMRNALLRGRLIEFGRLLNEAWLHKRQFGKKISSEFLDEVYTSALDSGAIGGKLLGAGGGGFFVFFVPPFRKHNVIERLEELNLAIRPFRFEPEGLQAWSARDTFN